MSIIKVDYGTIGGGTPTPTRCDYFDVTSKTINNVNLDYVMITSGTTYSKLVGRGDNDSMTDSTYNVTNTVALSSDGTTITLTRTSNTGWVTCIGFVNE